MRRVSFGFWMVGIILFSACLKKQPETISPNPFEQPSQHVYNEIRQHDTPVPVSYTLVERSQNPTATLSIYEGRIPLNQTKEFYLKEMERLGWDIVDLSHETESLLYCQKIKKHCAVSIRPDNKKTVVRLFTREQNSVQPSGQTTELASNKVSSKPSMLVADKEIY